MMIHWELCKKLKFDHANKWYMYNPRKWHTQNSLGFWHLNGSLNLGQTTRPYDNPQKKRTCKIMDIAVPADHRVKLKESEKKDKYFDLTRKLKKLWNIIVNFIPIIIGAPDTVSKGLLKGLEDLKIKWRVETIPTTVLLSSARILRRVLETWEDLPSLKLQWKTIILCWCEKLSKE